MGKATKAGKSTRDARGRFSEAGFTLVEVMTAMIILGIAMTAAYATFQFQHASFTVQNRVAEAQQNLRSALEVMSRDVRMAGYGIPDNVTVPAGVLPGGATSMRNFIPVNRTTGADEIYIMYLYDMDANQPPTTITSAMPNSSAEFNVASIAGFAVGDLVIITDGVSADLFEVTEVQGAALKLQHNPGDSANGYNNPGGHNTFPPGGYGANSTLAKVRFVRYFIDALTDPDHPTLMLDKMAGAAQPLADDIEDMQIQYGLDTNGDFVVDTSANSPTAAQIPQVKQMRLFLSARTRMTEKGWQDARPALADRAAGAADSYRRRAIENGIAIDLRNPG